jgi:hypothetical protein
MTKYGGSVNTKALTQNDYSSVHPSQSITPRFILIQGKAKKHLQHVQTGFTKKNAGFQARFRY